MARTGIELKPTHKAVKDYYTALDRLRQQDAFHEMAVRSAFQSLLADTARKRKWTLIPELSKKVAGKRVVPDGTIRDEYNLPRGYWEAKDSSDNLDNEIQKKIKKGYPLTNIIFEDTQTGVLYQAGREIMRVDLSDPQKLVSLVNEYFDYQAPNIEGFEEAVEDFKTKIPDLAKGLVGKIDKAHKDNKKFITAFDEFFKLCQNSLNPNISVEAVDEMLVQHLLTERLFRTLFDNPDFTRRNAIAVEVEKVIDALTTKYFNRKSFLKSLDRFYVAIERAGQDLNDYQDKQHFLNTVYERFFQGYSVKLADTHGIVYTPQPIVDFMCASVVEVLQTEFGLGLGDEGVNILDPCTGTGNFIVNLIRRIPKKDLPRMYREQLFANEVMLLPYYISAMNIEHEYWERTGEYEPFEGICFVDTLDMAEHIQTELGFMTEENTERVKRQRNTKITVIIGNPPYNVGQLNENDNNKNREYTTVDDRVKNTYAKDSKATLLSKLYDSYVKFFRWATDRLNGRDGIVCFVSNNSFIDNIAFDSMRKHLGNDFTDIYHIDLHGNVRTNPKLSGTTHNVFGIQVGVGITVAVRKKKHKNTQIRYFRVPEDWRKEEKYEYLIEKQEIKNIDWKIINPDRKHNWLVSAQTAEYETFLPLGIKRSKDNKNVVFGSYSLGVSTNRDSIVYDFNDTTLLDRVRQFADNYNGEVDRLNRTGDIGSLDDFVAYDKIKWSRNLKRELKKRRYIEFCERKIRHGIYRPFTKKHLFFDDIMIDELGQFGKCLPNIKIEDENVVICVSGIGSNKPFHSLICNIIPSLDILEKTQCFPFYTYNEDGSNWKENITDWALGQFRTQYKDKKISKWDVFYYVYGLLHHPKYREKYGDCLKRELPRIPYAPDFHAFAKAGKKLAKWHLEYEKVEPYKLKYIEDEDLPLSFKVEDKMRLNRDKKSLAVNPSLTLDGIPAKAFEYRLGNRSALEWVVDQYRIKEDKRSGIVSDPNNADDPEYIVRLVGQVIRVSLETVDIVDSLPEDFGG